MRWRELHGRTGWLIDLGFDSLALLVAIAVSGVLPTGVQASAWPFLPSEQGALHFSAETWNWSLVVVLLACSSANTVARGAGARMPAEAVYRFFLHGLIALALLSANLLTLCVLWAAVGLTSGLGPGAQHTTAGGSAISIARLLPVVFLIAAVATTGPIAWLFVALAAFSVALTPFDLRATEVGAAGEDHEQQGLVPLLGFSLIAWGLASGQLDPSFSVWVGRIGAAVAIVAALLHFGTVLESQRRLSWVFAWLGIGLLIGGTGAEGSAQAVAAAGCVMVLVDGLRDDRGLSLLGLRLRSATGTLMAAGIPFLVGAVALGAISVGSPALVIAGVLGMGLLAGTVLGEGLLARDAGEAGFRQVQGWLAFALLIASSAGLYFLLLGPDVPPAQVTLAAATLAVSLAAGLILRLAPRAGRQRIGRSLRWPDLTGVSSGFRWVGEVVAGAARAVRDVLEGDASLLWGFVILLVVYLALSQGS
jgi:hypothetical protein